MAMKPIEPDAFDIDDDDGWQDMEIIREDKDASGMDEEDQKKYHYIPSAKGTSSANATGSLLDVDNRGYEWRTKATQNESEYTRLRGIEDEEVDEVHLRTRYLFDEDKAMTPLSQMQATKTLLTEAQRVAYVGLCALTTREMLHTLKTKIGDKHKELKPAAGSMELWALKIMGRLYYHMELETQEQKMIESLSEHGVLAGDLVPALMTTHTVANPEYDPEEARRKAEVEEDNIQREVTPEPEMPKTPTTATQATFQTTARVLSDTTTASMPGVSTTLSAADENVTLDIRWTVLCDLFLILIADSVYDARSRVLLEKVAKNLGLGWLDVVKFESRVTEALEIQEDVEKTENDDIVEGVKKKLRKKRIVMLGLATLGGGLVIGLSAGILAPVIGAGLGAALGTIGITGTTSFLAGTAGAAMITTGGVLTGSGIAAKGMVRRTQQVRQFDLLPLHNNKRVSCILTVPGFLQGEQDDPRLPFSVLDPIVGDVFSVLWEPEMIKETGSALRILTGEVLTQIGQTVLSATVMTALMSALQWPIILTKLGYLIDNPWSNALDRAKAAGHVLADVLIQRHLGVRPITLIGFSLGARVIFYALLELAKQKAFGVVQDVFLLGATLSASQKMWYETRSVVSGRYVNAYARNDWVLNYLFRATSGGVGTVAGLREVQGVPGLENVDVTDKISGHMSYRAFMPLILDQLGFPVFADFFDDPVEPDFEGDRIVVREGEEEEKRTWYGKKKKSKPSSSSISRPPTASSISHTSNMSASSTPSKSIDEDEDLPPRIIRPTSPTPGKTEEPEVPKHAGFDLSAMKEMIADADVQEKTTPPQNFQIPPPPSYQTASSSPSQPQFPPSPEPSPRIPSHSRLEADSDDEGDIGSALPPPRPMFSSRDNVNGSYHIPSPPSYTPFNDTRNAWGFSAPERFNEPEPFDPRPNPFAGGSDPGFSFRQGTRDPLSPPSQTKKDSSGLAVNPWG